MNAKVLLIDDDQGALRTIEILLARLGHTVRTASDGREGLKLFNADPPDLVLTDIIMPDMEGIETIIEMRRARPGAKIIAMSGGGPMTKKSLLSMALKLGADAALAKPFDGDDLADAITHAFGDA